MLEEEEFEDIELPEIFDFIEVSEKEDKSKLTDLSEIETIKEIFFYDLQITVYNRMENPNEF
jgi:hypothetical protein